MDKAVGKTAWTPFFPRPMGPAGTRQVEAGLYKYFEIMFVLRLADF